MTDAILNAIAFANREEHGGAGFTLDIQLAHGEWLRDVDVVDATFEWHVPEPGVAAVQRLASYRLVGHGDGADLFVNPALVAQVVVKW